MIRAVCAALGWLLLVGNACAQQRLADPVRVVIASDSTASQYGSERWPRTGWGQMLSSYVDASVEVRNHAQSGRSARSFIEQGWIYGVAADLRAGDLLLIQFGHNDEKIEDPTRYDEPQRAFPFWLMRYVDLARSSGALPVLVTPVARRHFRDGRAIDLHGPYAEAVRALAQRSGVALIDLTRDSLRWLDALGEESSTHFYLHLPDQGTRDNTHFHERGAAAIACLVTQGLVRERLLDRRRLTRDIDCGVAAVPARTRVSPGTSRVSPESIYRAIQPGPHGGAGTTTAYSLFADVPDLPMVLRKRVLAHGAGIGLHLHEADEIYYVVSGRGLYTLDGNVHAVGPGDAMLTRAGSSHALQQTGDADLVVLISYLAKR